MFLTDKAKEDFMKYASHDHGEGIKDLAMMRSIYRNALIIQWFDSLGIFIQLTRFCFQGEFSEWYFVITDKRGVHLNDHVSNESRWYGDCRLSITERAIMKANEIYNNQNLQQ